MSKFMHSKTNNKETKSYLQGIRRLVDTMPSGIKKVFKKKGYAFSEIVTKWEKIVGNEISSVSVPKKIKLSKNNENGTLVIAIKRGSEVQIEYSKQNIINKINSQFGYNFIEKIKVETSHVDDKKLNKRNNLISRNKAEKLNNDIKKINNIEVRKSLHNLINEIKK